MWNCIQEEQTLNCDGEGRVEENQQNPEVGQSQTSGPETQDASDKVYCHSFIYVLCFPVQWSLEYMQTGVCVSRYILCRRVHVKIVSCLDMVPANKIIFYN